MYNNEIFDYFVDSECIISIFNKNYCLVLIIFNSGVSSDNKWIDTFDSSEGFYWNKSCKKLF